MDLWKREWKWGGRKGGEGGRNLSHKPKAAGLVKESPAAWWGVRDGAAWGSALWAQPPRVAGPFLHFGALHFSTGPGFPHFCSWKVSRQRAVRTGWGVL